MNKTHFEAGDVTAAFLGNPITSAISARKGKKLAAFKEAYGHQAVTGVLGGLGGAAVGAGLGALASTKQGRKLLHGGKKFRGGPTLRQMVGAGALAGGAAGSVGGNLKGTFDKKAREIRTKYMGSLQERVLSLAAQCEATEFKKIDIEDDGKDGSVVGTAAKVAGAGYLGSAAYRALKPMAQDRLAGLRSTASGFAKKPAFMQGLTAVGSVLKDKPLAALKGVGSTIAKDGGSIWGGIKRILPGARKLVGLSSLNQRVIEFAGNLEK